MKYVNCDYNYEKLLELAKDFKREDPCWVIFNSPKKGVVVNPSKSSFIKPEDIKAPDTYVKIPRRGGTMVIFKDAITMFYVHGLDFYSGENIKSAIRKVLENKGLRVVQSGNDLLVDGYKIAGEVYAQLPNLLRYYGISISINVDLDVIKKYCDKDMKKIPKGLSEFGITKEELMEAIMEAIEKQ